MRTIPSKTKNEQLLGMLNSLELVGDNKLQSVSDIAAHLMGTQYASVGLIDEKELTYLSTTGFQLDKVKASETFCQYAVKEASPSYTVVDAKIHADFKSVAWVKKSGVRFYMGVPISIEDCHVGTLCVFDESPRVPDAADAEMLVNLSKHISDIIELKRQHDQLMQLSLVAKHTENAVIITDKEGRIEYVNKAFERLSLYEFDEVVGLKPGDFLQGPDTNQQHVSIISEALKNQQPVNQEILNYTKEGEPYWLNCSISPVFDDQGLSKFIAVEHDITEQKAREQELRESKEEAQASMKLKEQFLSNMSHEIRTPMNGVIGIANILLDDEHLSAQQKEYVEHIHYSASNLLTVINDILDFSKINSEKLSFEASNFDLHQVFTALDNTIGFRAKEKGVSFELNLDPKMPKYACGDPGRLNQVLLNVVGNAIKFTEEGSVSVNAELDRYTEKGPQITVTVQDTGVGISKERLDVVFEEFQQESSYVSRKFGGSGLGLTISKKLVEMFDGDIALDSEEGVGTTVTFTIQLANPAIELKSSREQITPVSKKLPSSEKKSTKVLLVEDNIMNQIVALSPLEKAGYQVDIANNGLEAVEKAMDTMYDVILMDVQMPIMNGLEATQRIREMDTHTPILAMTASVMPHDLDKCFEVGMNDSIGKPLHTQEMLAKIDCLTSTGTLSKVG